MAYFITTDKYSKFTENPKENNIVNQVGIPITTILEDSVISILKSGYKKDISYTIKMTDSDYYYYAYNIGAYNDTISYQSSFDEVNKYSGISYRVLGLRLNTDKFTDIKYKNRGTEVKSSSTTLDNIGYGKYETDSDGNIISFGNSLEDVTDDDYEIIASGVCDISSTYLVTHTEATLFSNKTYYKKFEDPIWTNWWWAKDTEYAWIVERKIHGYQSFICKAFLQIYGVNKETQQETVLYNGEIKNNILFKQTVNPSTLVQNGSMYNGTTKLSRYIADAIFDNYNFGRPVAQLEWIGSPEVTYGTEIIVQPRKSYNMDELITYVVMGKRINYDGGYKETLYLVKKEV